MAGHLVAVQEKLQSENHQQALCKAVSLGLVLPADTCQGSDDDTVTIVMHNSQSLKGFGTQSVIDELKGGR